MAIARKMEITVIDMDDGHNLENFEWYMANCDCLVLVDEKNMKEYDFDFDEDAEYNKINYDYTQALLDIYRESAL